ncbi:competence type IV pilus assembly protein ComGB [Calidifontibacillus oryziterrae]|uniref:competence type IV pilus assembly protein ComGB n=1 Tax=Calidifontibacillus oryziterrae TaxID=1191699 RepID=UPI0002F4B8E9|nr:competence type IV pilus assembly protein ComGB [Calidifontibacillus oryziterrae]
MKANKVWKLQEQSKLFCRLGQLMQRGYSLPTALEFLMLNETKAKKQDLCIIIEMLKQGSPLHVVFQMVNFSKEGLSFIYFSEKYGELAIGLLNAGKMLAKKDLYRKKIAKLVRYPMFLLAFISILFGMMQQILIPQFIQLYESMNIPPSKLFMVFIGINSSFPLLIGICCVILLLIICFYLYKFRKSSPIEKQAFLCKLPLLNYFIKKYHSYFLSFHIGGLLRNGFSINDALVVFAEQNHIKFYKAEANRIRMLLLEGESLENILRETSYYERDLAAVIVHGQANSILSDELLVYSKLLLEQVEEAFSLTLRIIQPAIIILIGIGVVLMYLAIMLPLFTMIQSF